LLIRPAVKRGTVMVGPIDQTRAPPSVRPGECRAGARGGPRV